MLTFRVMCYHLNGAREAAGGLDLCAQVIRDQQPDLVFLQRLGSALGEDAMDQLAARAGLTAYGSADDGCALLCRFPLTNLNSLALGYGCRCIKADLDRSEQRVHLFNLSLSCLPQARGQQVRRLLSDQLFNPTAQPCATIVAGDFGLPLWGAGQGSLNAQLKRSRLPLWRANFPARIPLWGRERVYFSGPIRARSGTVVMNETARRASTHLPLLLSVEVSDPRSYLKVRGESRMPAKQPNPVCG